MLLYYVASNHSYLNSYHECLMHNFIKIVLPEQPKIS